MEPVLIIAYYFPPCNRTPAERIASWARHLSQHGYYPVVVTRKWEREIKSLADTSHPTSRGVEHKQFDNYEVYYLPFSGTLKDRLFSKFGNKRFVQLRKITTFFELIFQNLWWKASHLKPFKDFCIEYFQKNTDIKKAVISANPFLLFRLGYDLNKKYGIDWIADYRDAWTSSTIHGKPTGIKKWLNDYDSHFEKKWVRSAARLTSVSRPLAHSLADYTGVEAGVVENGFNKDDFNGLLELNAYDSFTIAYIGTLYEGQQVELFLEGYRKFIEEQSPNCLLLLPGLAHFDDQLQRVHKALNGYENYYKATNRIPRKEVLGIEVKAHYLLYVAWKGHAGIVPSKIYEYIASTTPVIVAPPDEGEVDRIVQDSNAGVLLHSTEEVAAFLKNAYLQFQEGNYQKNNLEGPSLEKYSREYQAGKLAETLNDI